MELNWNFWDGRDWIPVVGRGGEYGYFLEQHCLCHTRRDAMLNRTEFFNVKKKSLDTILRRSVL